VEAVWALFLAAAAAAPVGAVGALKWQLSNTLVARLPLGAEGAQAGLAGLPPEATAAQVLVAAAAEVGVLDHPPAVPEVAGAAMADRTLRLLAWLLVSIPDLAEAAARLLGVLVDLALSNSIGANDGNT